jgi:DNA-binding transcriptional ArsR family regulator
MVKQECLDSIFGSLSDPTRRDILRRVAVKSMSISEIAEPYDVSLAAVSKHLKILEKAELILKKRFGKEQHVELRPKAFKNAAAYLREYEKLWNARLDSLERYLSTFPR